MTHCPNGNTPNGNTESARKQVLDATFLEFPRNGEAARAWKMNRILDRGVHLREVSYAAFIASGAG